MARYTCPNCDSEDLKDLFVATAADGRSVVACDYCTEKGRVTSGEAGPVHTMPGRTDSPYCCHGAHYAPKPGAEAFAWAALRETPRDLTAVEQLTAAVLDAIDDAKQATDDGGCGGDWRESAEARAATAAVVSLTEESRVTVERSDEKPSQSGCLAGCP